MTTIKSRIEKLERAIPADGSCPTCGQTRPDPAALAKLRERAETRLAEILPHVDGDREAAIAQLREHSPTLSKYLPGGVV